MSLAPSTMFLGSVGLVAVHNSAFVNGVRLARAMHSCGQSRPLVRPRSQSNRQDSDDSEGSSGEASSRTPTHPARGTARNSANAVAMKWLRGVDVFMRWFRGRSRILSGSGAYNTHRRTAADIARPSNAGATVAGAHVR